MLIILAALGACFPLESVSCQDRIANAIRDLGARRIEKREQAGCDLRALGEKAVPALRKAALAEDLEVSTRARSLLSVILGELAYRKVRQRMVSSRNLRVALKLERVTQRRDEKETELFEGELALQGRDGVRFTAELQQTERKIRMEILSDGETTRYNSMSGEGSEEEAIDNLARKWKSVIVKTGVLLPAFIPGLHAAAFPP